VRARVRSKTKGGLVHWYAGDRLAVVGWRQIALGVAEIRSAVLSRIFGVSSFAICLRSRPSKAVGAIERLGREAAPFWDGPLARVDEVVSNGWTQTVFSCG